MKKERLGVMLCMLRGSKQVEGVSSYSVESIEQARSSYSVSSLMAYCNGIGLQLVVTDMATDESFPLDSTDDIHSLLQMLMERYDINDKRIYRITGIHYTPPKGNGASLSIVTFLAMCEALHCRIEFLQK